MEADLADDDGTTSSLDAFLDHEAYCEEQNVWFKELPGGLPGRDIHVLLKGQINEFALTARCDRSEFDYVLNEIRILNK